MRWSSSLLLLLACGPKVPVSAAIEAAGPPDAPQRAYAHAEHGVTRDDPYYWMKDKADPELIPYIEAENAYTTSQTAHLEPLRKTLYDEILGRIQEDDASVPVRDGDWLYYYRTEAGKDYGLHCRKKDESSPEEVYLDENALADGHEYFNLGGLELSPDGRIAAYATDTTGRELYTWRFKNLLTGELLPDVIEGAAANLVWAEDGKTVFYTTQDDTLRPFQLRRRQLGLADSDVAVYDETDEKFRIYAYKTRSDAYVVLVTASSLTTEVRVLPADRPEADWQTISPRHTGHEYSVDHHGDQFWIVTNDCDDSAGQHADCAVNFKVMKAPLSATSRAAWTEVIGHRDAVTVEGLEPFAGRVVILEREGGLQHFRLVDPTTGAGERVAMPEAASDIGFGDNPRWDATHLRFTYSSPVTPWSTYEAPLAGGDLTLLKEEPVPNYDRSRYEVERRVATAPDGTAIPMTVVRKKGLGPGPHPTLLYGYGSYGIPMDPTFSTSRASLLDRGVVYVIAHIRGGGDNGRTWYEDGKFLAKKNTFTDFIAVAKALIADGTTRPEQLAIQGGSAGGLLMGAVINEEPELFRAAVASVPFVDVVTTMLDASIPLTTNEWEEWGNPADKVYFDYMLSYSPYDNVAAKPYPALLIESGLNDPRVQYWEPTKWTAKLRDVWTTDRPLLLRTNMGAGHGGNSGRYGWIEDQAFRFAFVLDQIGATETLP